MNSQSKIIELVEEAVEAQSASLNQLANTIKSVFTPIPFDTEMKTKSHVIRVVKVCRDVPKCSGDREHVNSAKAVLVDHTLVAVCNAAYSEGGKLQHRCSTLRLAQDEGSILKLASTSALKSLASELPEALAQWIDDQRKEAAEIDAVTEKFAMAVATLTKSA